LRQLEGDLGTDVAGRVRSLALDAGWLVRLPDKLGERELTRQADLARLVRLAEELDDGRRTGAGFVAELRARFDPGGEAARGVQLLTYHRAKGLEFDAVFLPRLEVGELPSRLARSDEERAEERRLLYVGMTRARHSLALTWSRRPSPLLAELGVTGRVPARAPERRRATTAPPESPLYAALAAWRGRRARVERIPAFRVFHNRVLAAIAGARPTTREELAEVSGVGPAKLDRYGEEVLEVVAAA